MQRQIVTILGATGSIGGSTLDVLARHPERFEIFALTARRSVMESRHSNGPSTISSIMKNVGSFVRRDVSELSVEILGNRGFGCMHCQIRRREVLQRSTVGAKWRPLCSDKPQIFARHVHIVPLFVVATAFSQIIRRRKTSRAATVRVKKAAPS